MFYTFQPWQSSTSVLGMSRFSITKVNSLSSSFSTWMMEAQSQSLRIFLGRRLRIPDLQCAIMASLALSPEDINHQHPKLPTVTRTPDPGLTRPGPGPGLFTNTVQEVVFWNWKLNRKPTIGTLTAPTTALWENHDKSSRDQPAIGVYLRMYQGWLKKNSNVQCYSAPNTGGKCPTAQLPNCHGRWASQALWKQLRRPQRPPGQEVFEPPGRRDHYDTSHQWWNLWNPKENWSNIGTFPCVCLLQKVSTSLQGSWLDEIGCLGGKSNLLDFGMFREDMFFGHFWRWLESVSVALFVSCI